MKPFFLETFLLVCCCYIVNCAVIWPNNSTVANISLPELPPVTTTMSSTEIAIQRWKKTEKALKEFTHTALKSALPFLIKEMEKVNISGECTRSLFKVINGLKQMKLWAFKMIDASGKLPNGIFSGTITSLGDYEMCLGLNPGPFQGKYCSLLLTPPLPERKPFTNVDKEIPELSNFTKRDSVVYGLVERSQHYYHLSLRTSLCVPSTCSREDAKAIASMLIDSSGLSWDVDVPHCELKQSVVFDASQVAILCVFAVFLLLAGVGTSLDVYKKLTTREKDYKDGDGVLLQCLYCFSLYSNTKRLIKRDTSTDTIKVFHGMKVITLLYVILIHTYSYINFYGFGSLLTARNAGKDIEMQVILNGFLVVETFFFISAVLVVYGRMMFKDKDFTLFIYVFRRIWRLTPPLMFVIAFVFLMEHMGSGPIWKETVGTLVDNCRKNWWSNLLFFNNFIGSKNMCMQWSWYISVDTHLYLLAFLVLYFIKNRPKLGFLMIGFIFITCTVITAVTHIYYKLHPTMIYAFSHPDDTNYFLDHGYFRTYVHAATYCVGMTVGYIIFANRKMKIPLVANIIGWLVAIVGALTVLYGAYDWNQGNVPSLAVSTLYQCTNKLIWALALGWVTVACFTGNGGVVSHILSWEAFVPLSRLTYMAYLVHPLAQHMYHGSVKQIQQMDQRTMVFNYLGNVFAAYIGGFVFSQLFESPFMNLEKVMFSKKLKSAKSEAPREERNGKSTYHSNIEINGIHTLKINKHDVP